MRADELDFDLPSELIAQEPPPRRSAARLLHYQSPDRAVQHRRFSELPDQLRSGDLLVLNDARVIPARFGLVKPTGGMVEGLFLHELRPAVWQVMLKNLGARGVGTEVRFADEPRFDARVIENLGEGQYLLQLNSNEPHLSILDRVGRMPLPPYIRRDKRHDPRDDDDRRRYQTVYAQAAGSVAAPTAGLHFTDEIFQKLSARGVETCFVTLHVGLGTFKPITAENVEGHLMHAERYTIGAAAASTLNEAKRSHRRIIAVGTTAARVLESRPEDRPFEPLTAQTNIFIYPPYRWKHVAGLITNFHLPRSTLIAMVAAMVGLDEQRRLYQLAIEQRYCFFSYGDAMLIE